MADVLTTEDARAFWDARHRSRDDLTSGGDVSFDRASNELFYALRLGLLLQVLGDATNPVERLRLLDAGCGKGWFSRALGRFGYAVHGIDVSPVAIGFCRSESATERYTVSPLRTWSPGGLYDVVVSIDVLFHLLDDGEWSESLLNLASLSCGREARGVILGRRPRAAVQAAPTVSVASGLRRSPRRARVALRRLHAVQGS
jgi:SAM-dependent methyltransferase